MATDQSRGIYIYIYHSTKNVSGISFPELSPLHLSAAIPLELFLSQPPRCQLCRGPSLAFRGAPLPSYLFSD